MILYSQDKTTFEEVEEAFIFEGLENGTIAKETIKVKKKDKRPYKPAEQIFNELKEQGMEVAVKNGIHCKIVFGTYEAINEQSAIDDYDIYVRVER